MPGLGVHHGRLPDAADKAPYIGRIMLPDSSTLKGQRKLFIDRHDITQLQTIFL